MQFTGSNLRMVKYGIELALDELHNQIATCPDPDGQYADDIDEIEAEQERFKRLLFQIERAIEKESR